MRILAVGLLTCASRRKGSRFFTYHFSFFEALEIERKFLVVGCGYRDAARAADHLVQGYISTARGRTVRVRIRCGRGYLTIKGPADAEGVSRYEWEKEISPDDARDLMKLCLPGVIDKTRYLVDCGPHTWEVDEFHGDNEGLVVAEVELERPDEPYCKPAFVGRELTGDIRFYNSQLTLRPFSAWSDEEKAAIRGE